MKKLFYFLFLLLFFASCAKDGDLQGDAKKEPTSPYAVSIDAAIDNLKAVLGNTTRADGGRPVIDISRITVVGDKHIGKTTRSGETVNLPDTLLYIIPFEGENAGCAIVAADIRLTPVYAILDETRLTPDDFVTADVPSVEQSEQAKLKEWLMNGIELLVAEEIGSSGTPPLIPRGDHTEHFTLIVQGSQQTPLTKTKWHQRSPYNDQCPMEGIYRTVAGCVAIATGQLMAYYKKPNVIGSKTFDWNLLSQCVSGQTMSTAARSEVARFIHAIGLAVGMDYHAPENYGLGSSAYAADAVQLLAKSGFSAAKLETYNLSKIIAMLQRQAPVYTRAYRSEDYQGHAWVIDGYKIYITQYWERYFPYPVLASGPEYIDTLLSTESATLVHCNFGWSNGDYNGDYTSGIFNTGNGSYVDTMQIITHQ